MKQVIIKIRLVILLILISLKLFSQDIQLINNEIFKNIDTIKNIVNKRIVYKKYSNGQTKEIGIYVTKKINNSKVKNYVGYHLRFFNNGMVKDSCHFGYDFKLKGIGKGYSKKGKLDWIGISRDISIEEGFKYSRNRKGICDCYEIHYYENGNIESEFGMNLRNNSNTFADGAVCSISYNKNGTIKSSVFYDNN